MVFSGVGVALVSLFDDSGELEPDAMAEHAARLVDLGMSAVIVSGTTGEPMSLTRQERVLALRAVRAAIPDTVMIAGTGALSTREAVTFTRDAVDEGVQAVLALAPPAPVDIPDYYRAVVDSAGSTPALAYHFPAVWAPGFAPDQLKDFGVVGVKDSSGDPKRLFETLDRFDGAVYPGSPFLVHLAGMHGAAGAILAIGNLLPEDAVAAFAGDAESQRRVASTVSGLGPHRWKGLKAAVSERFGTSAYTRMA